MSYKFRFQDLEIWKEAISLSSLLIDIADRLEERKLFRFADQTRGVAMSISNNIAESTGTNKIGEQRQLLRYARRECFEAASILILLHHKNIVSLEEIDPVLPRLDILSRRINNYSNALKQKR